MVSFVLDNQSKIHGAFILPFSRIFHFYVIADVNTNFVSIFDLQVYNCHGFPLQSKIFS